MVFPFVHRLWSSVPRPVRRLLAGLLVLLAAYLAWLGGSAMWVRWDRGEAEKALAQYDFAEARRRLARCVKIHPHDSELRMLAAQTARRDGDPDSAEQQLDAYHDLVGGLTQREALERTLLKVQQGEMRDVVDALMESLELHHPESEHILEALVMGSVQSYELHRAQFWANELLRKWPKNAIGRLIHAQTIDTQGNRDKALALLKELVHDSPKYFKGRLCLADLLFKSRMYREAGTEYATLHEQQPDAIAPLLGLASSYARLEDADRARPLLKQLQEQYPNNSEVLLECGRFALDEKRPADAEPLLRRAADLAPADNEVQRELGICLEQLGQSEQARQHLDRSKQIEADLILLEKTIDEMSKAPNDPGPRRQAGEICLRNGQVAEGLRWLSGVLDMNPKDKATHKILADFYDSRGDTEQAELHRRLAQ